MTPAEIKSLRKSLGLSQGRFGRALGLDGEYVNNTVSKWERGKETPSGPIFKLLRIIKSHPELIEA